MKLKNIFELNVYSQTNTGGGVTAVIPQAKKEKGKKRSVDPGLAKLINDFGIEYAKSGR